MAQRVQLQPRDQPVWSLTCKKLYLAAEVTACVSGRDGEFHPLIHPASDRRETSWFHCMDPAAAGASTDVNALVLITASMPLQPGLD